MRFRSRYWQWHILGYCGKCGCPLTASTWWEYFRCRYLGFKVVAQDTCENHGVIQKASLQESTTNGGNPAKP